MRKFKIQISTETDQQKQRNVATNGNCILRKMGLKFQNPSFNPIQNSIKEKTKVDHDIDKFGSQLDRKSETWVFTFLNAYVT